MHCAANLSSADHATGILQGTNGLAFPVYNSQVSWWKCIAGAPRVRTELLPATISFVACTIPMGPAPHLAIQHSSGFVCDNIDGVLDSSFSDEKSVIAVRLQCIPGPSAWLERSIVRNQIHFRHTYHSDLVLWPPRGREKSPSSAHAYMAQV